MPFTRKSLHAVAFAVALILFVFFLPSLSLASGGGSAKFFVSAWLVRLWLAMVGGSSLVVGVMLAMDGYSKDPTIDPVMTPDAGVQVVKKYKLSYLKIGGGLLVVIFGCAFFVTSVFLLPDKRTGRSGMGKIISHFQTLQGDTDVGVHVLEKEVPSH